MPAIHVAGAVDLQREVLERVVGGVGERRERRELGRLEERDRRPVAHPEERVEVGDRLAGRRDRVVEHRVHELHAQDAGVEVGGGRGVARHVGNVAQHRRPPGLGSSSIGASGTPRPYARAHVRWMSDIEPTRTTCESHSEPGGSHDLSSGPLRHRVRGDARPPRHHRASRAGARRPRRAQRREGREGRRCPRGLHPTGVVATQDLDSVQELGADAFCYMATTHGRFKVAIGEVERILASGTNVVTTSFGLLVNPATARPDVLATLDDAGKARRRVVPVHRHRARVLQRLFAGRAQRLRTAASTRFASTSSRRTGPVSRATRSRSRSAASASRSTPCRRS